MSLVSRGIKVGSGTTAFAAATTILSAEVNTDFDTLYNDYNGNISNANVALAAAIAYAKLNLASSIVDADISASAGISGTKLANNSIAGVKLSDQPTGITTAKLNVGATTPGLIVATPNLLTGTSAETDLINFAAITTRGGRVFLQGTVTLFLASTVTGNTIVTLKVYRDAGVVATWQFTVQFATGAVNNEVPIPALPTVSEQPAAGTYVYKVTCATSLGGLNTPASNRGIGYLIEFA